MGSDHVCKHVPGCDCNGGDPTDCAARALDESCYGGILLQGGHVR